MTRFLVNCPHAGCGRRGRLSATELASGWWSTVSIVRFECPRCRRAWHARVIGDDVEALPVNLMDEEDETTSWPLVDIGAGG